MEISVLVKPFLRFPKMTNYLVLKFSVLSIDGPIRANRFADSRASPDSRESFQGSRTEPFFLRIVLPGATNCESQV